MPIRLTRSWKIALGLYIVGLAVFFGGPLMGAFDPPSGRQILMVLFVPASFVLMAAAPVKLPTKILIGLLLGTIAGFLIGPDVSVIKPIGTIFLRLIFMVIVPLVFASLFVGTQSLGDIRTMGRIGFRTVAFYGLYTLVGAALGLGLANFTRPGVGLTAEAQQALLSSFGEAAQARVETIQKPSLTETIVNIVPRNIVTGMSSDPPNMLQIVFFSIFMGIGIMLIPGQEDKKKLVVDFFEGVFGIMLQIINIAIRLAPYAVFALIADVVGMFGFDVLLLLTKYTIVTIGGLFLLFLSYIPLTSITTPLNMTGFLRGIWPVMTIAFSTSSSAASLPVMMETCRNRLGVSSRIVNFVLPLSITVNMNGSALYQAVSAVFIAQVYGIPLTLIDQIVIVLMATLSAVGAPGVPGASFMMLVVVLAQVGIPIEGIALVLGVERILDMLRTTVNIVGDATAAVVLAEWENELRPPPDLLKKRAAA
ncbi:MAG: dicarboxylate/amino acid:cation symporter [Acidobacteria bacterium]|nr:dicarboxylate/amino acid:cation symporter [Acidobacteriota bacterium]